MTNTRPGLWMTRGLCATLGAATWDELTPDQQRTVCNTPCAVASKCLAYGLATNATHVVYGGHQFPARPYRKQVAK